MSSNMSLRSVWQCMFGPRLVKVYGNGPIERLYEASALENLGDRVIRSLYLIFKLGIYTTPLIVGYLYKRGYFEADGFVTLTKFATLIGGILVVSFVIRGIGRSSNAMYRSFISVLEEAHPEMTTSTKQKLAMYDFEFYAWPVEFRWTDLDRDEIKDRKYIEPRKSDKSLIQLGGTLPCQIIGYLAVHTFGIRLVYPGSIGLLQNVLFESLLQGRSKLIEVNGGSRYKLQAKDGNEIDVMFVDKRNRDQNGHSLVICCEGNAGFYEIGIMGTPIGAGYSTLGWNHPGFGGSTGSPYPMQDLNAIDVVMQFAIKKLGFRVENIILFGWSIGGFTASWAAMNYPEVKGVILDASFDDIMPLAINHMPSWTEMIVRTAIRKYVNLNNIQQLVKYNGPVTLIRRLEDEVICIEQGDLATNRGNYLLIKLLQYRFPKIIGDPQKKALLTYLEQSSKAKQDQIVRSYGVNDEICYQHLQEYFNENQKIYPSNIGDGLTEDLKVQITIFLVRKFMKDYKSSHCTPLPIDMFEQPWDIPTEGDFVFT